MSGANLMTTFAFAPAGATVSFVTTVKDVVDRVTYTFTGVSLGAAASDRKVVVAISGRPNAETVSTVTIQGITATNVVNTTAVETDGQAGLWQADVPTGTTGNIVVTFSGVGSEYCGVGVFRVIGAATAAHATAKQIDTEPSTNTITIPANGVCISMRGDTAASSEPYGWTNLTEKYDENVAAAEGDHTGASDAFATLQTSRVLTCDATGLGDNIAMVSASWGPA